MGPRTLPCGTPLVAVQKEENMFQLWIVVVYSDRNALIQLNKRLSMPPYKISLVRSLLCTTESKAFAKSSYTTSVCFLLDNALPS